jgi:hypothetical protein
MKNATACARVSTTLRVVDYQDRELIGDRFDKSFKAKPCRIGHEPNLSRWGRPAKRQR